MIIFSRDIIKIRLLYHLIKRGIHGIGNRSIQTQPLTPIP